MKKRKFVFFLVSLVFLCFFLFFYFKDKEIRELNKNLPQGVYFEKRGKELFLINKLDGYELKIPKSWEGVREVRYVDNGVHLEGKNYQLLSIFSYSLKDKNISVEKWVSKEVIPTGKFVEPKIIEKTKISFYEVIGIKDFGGMMGELFFFYLKRPQGSRIYEFLSDSKEVVKEAIVNFILKNEK